MRLRWNLYELQGAGKIWFQWTIGKLGVAKMREGQSAPRILQGKGVIAVCYIEDLLLFGKAKKQIDHLKINLSGGSIMKHLGTPKSILGLDLISQKMQCT